MKSFHPGKCKKFGSTLTNQPIFRLTSDFSWSAACWYSVLVCDSITLTHNYILMHTCMCTTPSFRCSTKTTPSLPPHVSMYLFSPRGAPRPRPDTACGRRCHAARHARPSRSALAHAVSTRTCPLLDRPGAAAASWAENAASRLTTCGAGAGAAPNSPIQLLERGVGEREVARAQGDGINRGWVGGPANPL